MVAREFNQAEGESSAGRRARMYGLGASALSVMGTGNGRGVGGGLEDICLVEPALQGGEEVPKRTPVLPKKGKKKKRTGEKKVTHLFKPLPKNVSSLLCCASTIKRNR